MIWFEILVPLIGFAVAGVGIWAFRRGARRLERGSPGRTPAE